MKFFYSGIIALIFCPLFSFAQWTTSGNDIYNTNTGNVGIGTTTPLQKFTIKSSGTQTGSSSTDYDFGITDGATNQLQLLGLVNTGGNYGLLQVIKGGLGPGNLVMQTQGGNVGIGTTSPNEKLDINGALTFSGTTTGYPTAESRGMLDYISNTVRLLGFGTDVSTYPAFQIYQAKANNIDGRVVLQILNNGYVGIGTTNPLTKAQIQDAGTVGNNLSVLTLTNNTVGTAGNAASIDLNPTSDIGSVYSRFGSIMETSNRAGVYISTYNPSTGLGERLRVDGFGNVGIGTTTIPTGYKLAVAGNAIAESMTVKLQANWPDVVFKKDYALMPLSEVKTYIDKNQHLPEIPAAAEVEKDGVNLGEMNRLLVKKVEELTLYLIEKDNKDKDQQEIIKQLQAANQSLEEKFSKLAAQLNELAK